MNMKNADWSGYGEPPWEIERKRLEELDLSRRIRWVGRRRLEYPNEAKYEADARRAINGWEHIQGPDGKGAER